MQAYAFLRDGLTDPARNAAVGGLAELADELGVTTAQLAAIRARQVAAFTQAQLQQFTEPQLAALFG